jgi:hypothetical protein
LNSASQAGSLIGIGGCMVSSRLRFLGASGSLAYSAAVTPHQSAISIATTATPRR